MVEKQNGDNHQRADDVQRGDDRITERFIRTFCVGARLAQTKDARDSHDVEDERGGDDVGQKIIVKAAVSRRTGRGVCSGDGARQDEQPIQRTSGFCPSASLSKYSPSFSRVASTHFLLPFDHSFDKCQF